MKQVKSVDVLSAIQSLLSERESIDERLSGYRAQLEKARDMMDELGVDTGRKSGTEVGNGRKGKRARKAGVARKAKGTGTVGAKSIPKLFADAFKGGKKTAKEVEAFVKGHKGKFRPLTPFIKGGLITEAGHAPKAKGSKGKAAALYTLTAKGHKSIKSE